MAFSLLDLRKSRDKKRLKTGFVEYQSLPVGIYNVRSLRFGLACFFEKVWYITFEGKLNLNKLEEICKQKECYLIQAKKVKDKKFEEWNEDFRRGLMAMDEMLKESSSGGVPDILLECGLDFPKPDMAYYVYKGKKEIAYVSCDPCGGNTFFFSTSKKAGLELVENYRINREQAHIG